MAGNAQVQVFNCPKCGAGVTLRALGRSLSVACGSCGSVIDPTNENYRILSVARNNQARESLDIPLGTRGSLRGDPWEVIGFMVRSTQTVYRWKEYLLFNPYKGYRFLTEYDGHWTFVSTLKDRPASVASTSLNYMGQIFRLFHTGRSRVEYVVGEFYWRVRLGEEVQYRDYISPPEMVSLEENESERVWSLSEYEEPSIIARAFSISNLPKRVGIGASQPFKHLEMLKSFWSVGLGFIIVLFLIHLLGQGIFSNFLVCSFLIFLPPLLLRFHHRNFELKRWGEESDLAEITNFFSRRND